MESRKYKMIEKLLKVQEEDTLYRLESILDSELSKDSYDELPEDVKKVLDASIEQSKNGYVKPHEQVMLEMKKRFGIA